MAYKALYRTYRPQKFSDVIGQDIIVKTLQNSISSNRISHAYLFCGPRGTGKTTIARIFSKALNCKELQNFEPCHKCSSCLEITDGASPDVIEIDAASNNGVDEIREIKDKVKFLPAGAKYKIYIIDEVHMLSTSAFNALLKTLEEPPKHAIFILATTEPHKVLPTILSRCQRFDFKALTIVDLTRSLQEVCVKENIKYEKEALVEIASASEGGFRDALGYLDQAIALCDEVITAGVVSDVTGLVKKTDLVKLANFIEDKKIPEVLLLIQDFLNDGREISKIINSLLSFYRDILLYKNIENQPNKEYLEFALKVDIRKVYFNIDVLSEIQAKTRFGNTPEIYFEVAIIKMINASNEDLDYGKRLAALESKILNLNVQETPGANIEDMRRLKILEEKFNHLLGELSKLEIPKLAERIRSLEQTESGGAVSAGPNLKELNVRIDKIIEDLELLKVVQSTFRNELENTQTGTIDEELLADKIDEVVKKNKATVNYSEIEAFVNRQLKYFEEKVNDRIIKQAHKDSFETSTIAKYSEVKINEDDLSGDLEERLAKIESNIYKIMAGLLSTQSASQGAGKKERKKVDEKQISLWKDEIVSVDKIVKTTVEPKTDFMELGLEDEAPKTRFKENERKIAVTPKAKSKEIKDENLFVKRNDVSTNKDEAEVNVWNDETGFGNEKLSPNSIDAPTESRKVNELQEREVVLQKEKEYRLKLQEQQLEAQKRLTEQRQQEQFTREAKNNQLELELSKEVEVFKNDSDEYERYDVKVLERIMNDSFSAEYASEKQRLTNLWKHLIALSPVEKRGIAELLSEGEIKVVGNREFVLIYPNAVLCNQVMSRRFKRSSLKMLFDLLNGDYNYFAITKKIWEEKREEYANQYYLGTKHPTLTPLNDHELRVADDIESEDDKMMENILDVFGENITIKKKE